jgi:single-strand DNA-binding protein
MADINHVVLVGRLTRDAELKYTPGGLAVCNLGLAVNRRVKQGDQWADEANFFDVTLFGKLGESIKQYLVKGKQVAIEGELRQDRWEKDGQKHSKVFIVANNVMLLGGGKGGPAEGGGFKNEAAPGSAGATPKAGGEQFEDDIPF